jgi:hypothetical protein
MSWVYKPTRVEVMGSHGCGCGLADRNPGKTRTRGVGLVGLTAREIIIYNVYIMTIIIIDMIVVL